MGDYYAINAKVAKLKNGLLSKEDYEEILEYKDRSGLLAYLQNNPIYKEKIQKYLKIENTNRRSMENIIMKVESDQLIKLRHHFSGNDKTLIDAMLTKYEFEDIKLIFRSIAGKEPIDKKLDLMLYGREKYLSYDKLLSTESIPQAIEYISTTPYRKIFIDLADEDVLRLHFHSEMRLDSAYFMGLKSCITNFKGKSRQILENYVTTKIDIFNVKWIYRAKKYYDIPNEEIFNYSFRFGKKTNGEAVKALVYSTSQEDFFQKIRQYKLDDIFQNIGTKDVIVRYSLDYIYDKVLKHVANYENDIGMFLKFYVTMMIQNKNIIRISEAQKYGLNKTQCEKYLVKIA